MITLGFRAGLKGPSCTRDERSNISHFRTSSQAECWIRLG
jgi:hypothetical protein